MCTSIMCFIFFVALLNTIYTPYCTTGRTHTLFLLYLQHVSENSLVKPEDELKVAGGIPSIFLFIMTQFAPSTLD